MGRVPVDVTAVFNQAVLGHGISDLGGACLGEGDHHQDDDVLQDLSTRGPFIQALKQRKLATFEIQEATDEQRVRRTLDRDAQYKKCQVRSGDCVASSSPCTEKDGKMNEARRFGPAEVVDISGATGHIFLGGVCSVP